MAERVVGHGSFGVVFQAKCLETGEAVAIKKVLQDKRYKNRELQTMRVLDHPNVVALKHCFFSTTEKEELYLNLVLEYVPETVHRVIKHYNKMNQRMPMIYVKLYSYQVKNIYSFLFYRFTFNVGSLVMDIKVICFLRCRFSDPWPTFMVVLEYVTGISNLKIYW